MKDIFARRAEASFAEVFDDMWSVLEERCGEAAHCAAMRAKASAEKVDAWHKAVCTPLPKGSAKYLKAVKSITGEAATVLHAIAYRDLNALEHAELFSGCGLKTKVDAKEFPAELLWQYCDELNNHCFKALSATRARVPTVDEIRANIQRRKGGGAAGAQPCGTPVLKEGVLEMWRQLAAQRGITIEDEESVLARVSALTSDAKANAACAARGAEGAACLCDAFPYLDASKPFSDDDWGIVTRVFALTTMNDSIPAPMMRGIEQMASNLAKDMSNGTMDFSKLNMESIGRDVLSGVSEADMSHFARNLNKILPAMQNFNG